MTLRTKLLALFGTLTMTAAAAGTFHSYSVSTIGGSGGSVDYLQTTSTGSALQGEVASSGYTALPYPFGLFGFYHASQFGIGTLGISTTGYGIAGASSAAAQPSILAYAESGGAGLEALTTTSGDTAPAVYAATYGGADANGTESYTSAAGSNLGTNWAGVRGFDTTHDGGYNDGVDGFTTNDGFGVRGVSTGGALGGVGGLSTGGDPGVTGTSDSGDGVLGSSTSGIGVHASAGTGGGIGVYALAGDTASTPAPNTYADTAVYANAANGAGVFSYANQDPPYAAEMHCDIYTSSSTLTSGQNCSGLFIQIDGTHGYPLQIYAPNATCHYPFYSDASGNLTLCGHLTTAGGTLARTRNPGSDVVTYSAQQTESTVEDFGNAELVNGQARVALGSDFRQTINAGVPYMVFLTPYGDTRGLFVASRTPDGFTVREAQGGRSTMAFDYRIVARPYGQRVSRLPHAAEVSGPAPRAPASAPNSQELRRAFEARMTAAHAKKAPAPGALSHIRRYVPPPIPAEFAKALRRIR